MKKKSKIVFAVIGIICVLAAGMLISVSRSAKELSAVKRY